MTQGETEERRPKPMVTILLIATVAILLLVGGQTLLKVGLNEVHGVQFLGGSLRENVLKMFATPYFVVGFALYGLSAFLWLDVLSKLEFSFAFPLVSMTYVFSLIIGRLVFHETITPSRVVGVLIVCLGLFFIVRSR
jgi:drug/metabolite transporter (DMT)-like permease